MEIKKEIYRKKIGSAYTSKDCGLAFFIEKRFRKKGYGRKVFFLLIEFSGKDHWANVNAKNKGMIRFMKKLGFKEKYICFEKVWPPNEYVEVV